MSEKCPICTEPMARHPDGKPAIVSSACVAHLRHQLAQAKAENERFKARWNKLAGDEGALVLQAPVDLGECDIEAVEGFVIRPDGGAAEPQGLTMSEARERAAETASAGSG